MKTSKLLTIALLCCILFACNNEEPTINETNDMSELLIGSWNYADKSYNSYIKMRSLKADEYGFTFLSEGKFIERTYSSWCGTPPIFADYEGIWTLKDSIIHISTTYWGGKIEYEWKVVGISTNTFAFERIETIYPRP